MTTDHQMEMAYAAQEEVIVALTEVGEVDLADRLERCMTARHDRRGGDGWPFTCRSAACVWCRPPLIRGWWNGMCRWSAEAATTWVINPDRVHGQGDLGGVMAGSAALIGWDRLRATIGTLSRPTTLSRSRGQGGKVLLH
jgi:hypothetical protein